MSLLDSIYRQAMNTKKDNTYSSANKSDQEYYAILDNLKNNLSGDYGAGVEMPNDGPNNQNSDTVSYYTNPTAQSMTFGQAWGSPQSQVAGQAGSTFFGPVGGLVGKGLMAVLTWLASGDKGEGKFSLNDLYANEESIYNSPVTGELSGYDPNTDAYSGIDPAVLDAIIAAYSGDMGGGDYGGGMQAGEGGGGGSMFGP